MAIDYPLPPWLTQHADPVSMYAHGLQIGSSIGAQQAHQQLLQEQMLREQQKTAVEQEYRNQVYQLKADEAARQYAAQAKFTQLINSGMDPQQALLQTPELANKMGSLVQMMKGDTLSAFEKEHVQRWKDLTDIARNKKVFRDVGGALYQENPDGTVVQVVPKAPRKAVYTYTKTNGDKISGTTDDPEIAALKAADDAAKAKKAAEEGKPSPAWEWIKSKLGAAPTTPTNPLGQYGIPSTATATTASPATKLEMARQIRGQNPTWSKQQVIDEVNRQFSAAPQGEPTEEDLNALEGENDGGEPND